MLGTTYSTKNVKCLNAEKINDYTIMEELQMQINKLYNDNYIPSLVVYNNLLDKITRKNEMEATVFIYDHMKKNNIKPNDLTFKYINRLHSKTIPESKTIVIKDNGKKKLQPRRRIHKIMKGYNYDNQSTCTS